VLYGTLSISTIKGKKQEVLGRTNRLVSLIRHGPHWKRRVQQFFYCCVCIRYRGNVSTEPLPSNDRGIFTEPLPSNDKKIFAEPLPSNDEGIFTGPLPSNDKGTYTEPFPSNNRGDTQTHTHSQTAMWSHLLLFFLNKESRRIRVQLELPLCLSTSLSKLMVHKGKPPTSLPWHFIRVVSFTPRLPYPWGTRLSNP
jgi:hypothetical protein